MGFDINNFINDEEKLMIFMVVIFIITYSIILIFLNIEIFNILFYISHCLGTCIIFYLIYKKNISITEVKQYWLYILLWIYSILVLIFHILGIKKTQNSEENRKTVNGKYIMSDKDLIYNLENNNIDSEELQNTENNNIDSEKLQNNTNINSDEL